jgi:hypothetical protein
MLIGAVKYISQAEKLLVLNLKGGMEYYGPPRRWKDYEELLVKLDDPNSVESGLTPSEAKQGLEDSRTTDGASMDGDIKRQRGDLTDWLYYAKSVGLLPLLGLAIFTLMTTACMQFPSKLCLFSSYSIAVTGAPL